MVRKTARAPALDTELAGLSPEARWQEWRQRIEAVLFAARTPVSRAVLASVVGPGANLDLLLEDLAEALRDRPYQIVAVAGGWQFRTRPRMAPAIHHAGVAAAPQGGLGRDDLAVLLTIAWSFSAALSARISWKKRNTTPRTTITKITTVARRSPVRKEITPSARSRRTNGFAMLATRRIRAD